MQGFDWAVLGLLQTVKQPTLVLCCYSQLPDRPSKACHNCCLERMAQATTNMVRHFTEACVQIWEKHAEFWMHLNSEKVQVVWLQHPRWMCWKYYCWNQECPGMIDNPLPFAWEGTQNTPSWFQERSCFSCVQVYSWIRPGCTQTKQSIKQMNLNLLAQAEQYFHCVVFRPD